MYRFERSATVKTAGDLPAALKFATEVTSYLNKRHSLNMKCGAEIFGGASIHWYFDADSLDKMTEMNDALLKDREYLGMLDNVKGVWAEGSMKDTIVGLA